MVDLARAERILDRVEALQRMPVQLPDRQVSKSEIDLVIQGLERKGSTVTDYWYHEEGISFAVDGSLEVGEGIPIQDCFFFGHVSLYGTITGAITLAGKNLVMLDFARINKGSTESGINFVGLAIGNGFNALGDGTYILNKRLYGMGFNKVLWTFLGFAAANKIMYIRINGYIFKMR